MIGEVKLLLWYQFGTVQDLLGGQEKYETLTGLGFQMIVYTDLKRSSNNLCNILP